MENKPTSGPRYEGELPKGKHPLQLYSLFTPNGRKVAILLEELGVAYDAWCIRIFEGEQFSSSFVGLNPNEKIPVLLDTEAGPNKTNFSIMESGAILVYLAEKYPEAGFLPSDPLERSKVMQWVMWQMGSGPYFGQFGHFYKYAKEKIPYGINRYTTEVKRLVDVLDKQLGRGQYVAGDQYSIADMAIFPWINCLKVFYAAEEYLELKNYKNVARWYDELMDRPAVKMGLQVNDPNGPHANYSTVGRSETVSTEISS